MIRFPLETKWQKFKTLKKKYKAMKEQNEELQSRTTEATATEAEKRRIKTTTINSLSVIEEVSPTYKTTLDPQILEQ